MANFKDTVHALRVKFGFNTVHKFPTKEREVIQFLDLTDQLYPTGRAWRMFNGTRFEDLHKGINDTFLTLQKDAYSLLDTAIPNGEDFTIQDCLYWEGKLGLISNNLLTLERRRQTILNKLSFPGNIKARQGLNYIQSQLELYGFDNVRVYNNIFYDENGNYYYKQPSEITQNSAVETQHGGTTQHGAATLHGSGNFEVIANEVRNESYSIGGNEYLYATFFIAGKDSLYERGRVEKIREEEFKELILKLKPAHLVAFAFVNYN